MAARNVVTGPRDATPPCAGTCDNQRLVNRAPNPTRGSSPASLGRFGYLWIAFLVLYSFVRALIVGPTLGPYGIDPWLFLVIDAGSAFPLASGQVRLVHALRRRSPGQVQRWVAVVAVCFLAPYAYLLLGAGVPLPLPAYAVIGLLVLGLGAATVWRIRSEAAKANATTSRLPRPADGPRLRASPRCAGR